jgi:hypothetical protein
LRRARSAPPPVHLICCHISDWHPDGASKAGSGRHIAPLRRRLS